MSLNGLLQNLTMSKYHGFSRVQHFPTFRAHKVNPGEGPPSMKTTLRHPR